MKTSTSSKQERRKEGKEKRHEVARSSHARLKREKTGRDAYALLQAAAVDRVPHLMPLKYERMMASPFGYFRGAVPVMAYDLGRLPHTGIVTQLCGDAHVQNLGAFAAPDGRVVFDLNDFDETTRGPFEWDVKRMAASLHVAAREAGESEADCRESVRVFLHRYGKAVEMFAAMPIVEIARYQIHRQTELASVAGIIAGAERSKPLHLRDALTEPAPARSKDETSGSGAKKNRKYKAKGKKTQGKAASEARVFRSDPPVLSRLVGAEASAALDAVGPYLQTIEAERQHLLGRYEAVDVAFKVVGTGSVGLRNYVIYMEGNGPGDPLFLQMKQETASAWAPYLPRERGAAVLPEGQRVVLGQRAMQVQSDPFLGWTHLDGHDFLVRQLNDHKGSVDLSTLDAESLAHYADLCGELLARGHSRAGDPDALGGYLGKGARFEKAVADFAGKYADQTEEDWKQLKKIRKM